VRGASPILPGTGRGTSRRLVEGARSAGAAGLTTPPLQHRLRRRSPSPCRGGIFLALLVVAAPAFADSSLPPAHWADTQLPDPKQEAAASDLMETLRCLVCQGQSIADSDAELAGDMRALVRSRIAAGEKPEAIRHWLIERYGAWVTYKPPLEPLTWPLWAAPILLIAAGLLIARARFRRRKG
jgi:cytochrome c-type biogenesis protein CcmH